jgi:thiamine-monophosphate kinase
MTRDPSDPAQAREIRSEEALIAEFWAPLAAGFSGAFGLKDDCAVIAPPAGAELVVTTDAVIAGVHFFPDADPGAIAWKALAVNVSDLVAKGAAPLAYLMSIALPEAPHRAWLEKFTQGLRAAQDAFGCRLAGGDTDRTPGPLSVSITAFGVVPAGGMVRRATARPGDHVYVSSTIGDAALGLALRRDPALRDRCRLDLAAGSYLEGKFSRPHPPVALVPIIRTCASAAMDISDGLIKDFHRLCRVSGVGGRIEAPRVPLSDAARAVLGAGGATHVDLLTGGEDYGVLATVPSERAGEFERRATEAGTRVTCVGAITDAATGVIVTDAAGEAIVFTKTGWDHFQPPDVI